ncbi:hypothetical protein A2962_05495 [Candidatus Woesebacteria bacterium RIFCSPLOWO2_01_FULL_39_61]|uniref:Nudix hydrolase domain-containing protein n=2 Tax=Microgenomates group TaxID=1794810 RepID=A0A1F7Z3Q7_9BACT|nr:putative NUDIX hydrolase [uncultured Microgenomates bacterium Rifle_16ft_4_minimus_37836]OGM28042.1 MAG: hypothetical protein A2692_05235 [Candidatus Woesebacteria bacterium RIFCSPHIGHO2_01_FULL_39_95]OGM34030.1 MAG: hypothetical protein A3D01_03805 [Candidatus Woesebacteria bacterium RIFCSPHIGHO2_02_FULL_39_13]OGM38288.1 MAG: hypothetical protein A3E13_05915 [Candidatus Woesebacteria bacterium RIFCSPHIGHO2_12_FULL_40_20]OGM67751.1 MAG: hypothetical protein A2962_05495 [Candidatus Woesebacte
MSIEIDLHQIQKDVLVFLLFKRQENFSGLNRTGVPSDQFNFHLRRLIELGLVKRSKNKTYRLTPNGKEFSNRLDTESRTYEKQAKIGVLICCVQEFGGETNYLIQQRLKEPYFGFYGFLTGKVRLGETVFETALRELKEETGYAGKVKLVGIKHKMDYSKDGNLLEDKFFFVMKATDIKGNMTKKFEGGRNIWATEKEIFKLPNLFDGVKDTLDLVKQNKVTFLEKQYKISKF